MAGLPLAYCPLRPRGCLECRALGESRHVRLGEGHAGGRVPRGRKARRERVAQVEPALHAQQLIQRDGAARIAGGLPGRHGRRLLHVQLSLADENSQQRVVDRLGRGPAVYRRVDAEALGIAFRHHAPVVDDDDRVGASHGLAIRLGKGPVERRLQAGLGRRDDLRSRDVGQAHGDRPIGFDFGPGRRVGRLRPIQVDAAETVPIHRAALEAAHRPGLDLTPRQVHLMTQRPVEPAEDRIARDVFVDSPAPGPIQRRRHTSRRHG